MNLEFVGSPSMVRTTGRVTLAHWTWRREGAVRPHAHTDAHFMFVTGGLFRTSADRRDDRVASPLIFNPPATHHDDAFESERGAFFTVTITGSLLSDIDAPRAPIQLDEIRERALVRRLMRESAAWDADSPRIAEELCRELLDREATDSARPAWLARAEEMLRLSASTTEASRGAGVHPTHLIRTFRRFHRCTPAEFARIHRLERAAQLLARTRQPIVDVALECGFSDQSHFTKHFHRAFGVAPGKYRAALR
jgi:AraC family transcriptional regulator